MVAYVRYVPPGYVDAEGALLRIAKALHPDRWRPELLHPKEAEIYAGLGTLYKADYLRGYLRSEIPKADLKENAAIADRMYDFEDAVYDLRIALHAGDLVAGYCDERGKFGWIESTIWGGDQALQALLRGIVTLEDGWVRLILFKIESIGKFINGSRTTPASTPRLSKATINREWGNWRDQRKGNIPTEDEDFEHMRKFGARRDEVRELRDTAPKLKRGRPPGKTRDKLPRK
jgi:hypothetical protein